MLFNKVFLKLLETMTTAIITPAMEVCGAGKGKPQIQRSGRWNEEVKKVVAQKTTCNQKIRKRGENILKIKPCEKENQARGREGMGGFWENIAKLF